MTDVERKLCSYFTNQYIETLMFSNNIEEELEDKDRFLNLLFVSNLYSKLKTIIDSDEQFFPKKSIDNLEKIIEFINSKDTELLNVDDEIIMQNMIKIINKNFEKVKEMDINENIYFYEYLVKKANLEDYKNFKLFDIEPSKEEIEDSINFDFKVINILLKNDFEELDYSDIRYLYSIKKFFNDLPEMFLDYEINRRTIYILEQQNNKEAKILISKMNKIEHRQENSSFDICKFKSLYDYILTENIMVSNNVELDYKNLIEEETLKTIYYIIDKDLIYNKECNDNIKKVLFNCSDYVRDNYEGENIKEFFEKYNEYLGKLNLKREYSCYELYNSEMILRYSKLNILKIFLNLKNNFEDKLKELLKLDLEIIKYYLDDKYDLNKFQDKEVELSIFKFYNLVPSIFNNETIYNKTIDLLNLSKKSKNKKLIKSLKKNFYDFEEIN